MTTKDISEILTQKIAQVINGKTEVIKLLITAFLTGGHVLIEDVPGVGKTTMVKALSKLIKNKKTNGAIEFKRIQCTPDLLPYDITGVDIFNPKTQTFDFLQGPIFCNILLADELNRTPPKVQSALLEVMEEHQVTIGTNTHALAPLFFVAATQNPVEMLGTYPLPPAQLDRFMISISIGYPDEDAAFQMLSDRDGSQKLENIESNVTDFDILNSKEEQNTVFCHPELKKAIIDICTQTRNMPEIELGASPRASIQFLKIAKTFALVNNRTWIEDSDLQFLAPHVLAHRCIFKNRKLNGKEFIQDIVNPILCKMNKKTNWAIEQK